MGCLGHAAGLHDSLEDVQVPQLDAAADPVCPLLHVDLLVKWVMGIRKLEIPCNREIGHRCNGDF
jgi:hypothetical protein